MSVSRPPAVSHPVNATDVAYVLRAYYSVGMRRVGGR